MPPGVDRSLRSTPIRRQRRRPQHEAEKTETAVVYLDLGDPRRGRRRAGARRCRLRATRDDSSAKAGDVSNAAGRRRPAEHRPPPSRRAPRPPRPGSSSPSRDAAADPRRVMGPGAERRRGAGVPAAPRRPAASTRARSTASTAGRCRTRCRRCRRSRAPSRPDSAPPRRLASRTSSTPRRSQPDGEGNRTEIDITKQVLTLYENYQVRLVTTTSTGSGEHYCYNSPRVNPTRHICEVATTPSGRFTYTRYRDGLGQVAARPAVQPVLLQRRHRGARLPVGADLRRRRTAAPASRCTSPSTSTRSCTSGDPVYVFGGQPARHPVEHRRSRPATADHDRPAPQPTAPGPTPRSRRRPPLDAPDHRRTT